MRLVLNLNCIQPRQEAGMHLCQKMSRLHAGIGIDDSRCLLQVGGFKDSGADDLAVIGNRACKEDATRLSFAAEPCQVSGHQVFVAVSDVPAQAFFQQA